jgi:hypothetical protein
MTRLVLIFTIVLLAGCRDGPVAPAALLELANARARWQTTRPIDYSYVTYTLCFCPRELTQPTRVEVRGDTVSAVRTLDGTLVPRDRWYGRAIIDSLFARALEARRDASTERVRVTYDPTFGYPTLIDVVSKPGIADAGSVTHAADLRPLPVP